MQRTLCLIITFFCIFFLSTCTSIPEQNWTKLVPGESTFLIIPKSDIEFSQISETEYTAILDDLTPTAFNQSVILDSAIIEQLDLKALVLYPAGSTNSQFLWISTTNNLIEDWASVFYEPFSQNNYSFSGILIHKLRINELDIFAAQVHKWLVLSPSSRTVESSLRAYLGASASMDIALEPAPGQLIVNSEHIDQWVQQFVNVNTRPSVMGSFQGLNPVVLTYISTPNSNQNFIFKGTLTLNDTAQAELVSAVTFENKSISLDHYIASNSSAFALFRLPPKPIPPPSSRSEYPLDSLLLTNSDVYRDLALSLDAEFALVTFPESGLLATGEFLLMRKLVSSIAFRKKINDLASLGIISAQGESSYYVKSELLSKLIGSEFSPFSEFYLSFSGNVVVISKRRGLSESVESDRNRRRVIYYNETYAKFRDSLSNDISGLVWAVTNDFLKFIRPFLLPRNSLEGLIGQYDITAMAFIKEENSNLINFSFKSLEEEDSIQPYDELWIFPLGEEKLSGSPVFVNLIGSTTKELIFATQKGNVRALAYDGTVVMNATTNGELPVGSPVLYDWYGNRQPVVLLAAGTKVFAWNEEGSLLPQFPIEIGERISAPIVVTDVLRNGIPEIIVATENRRVHVIDGRGQNIRGWPQSTNAIVTNKPVFAQIDGMWSIWVFSQNVLHSWLRDGGIRSGYPTFINATFTGSPQIFKDKVLGSATDGYIYSIGKKPSFKDSIAIGIQMDSISIKSLYAANSPLTSLSAIPNVLLKDSTSFYRSDLYVTQSANGSVFMFNEKGELEITYSLGQPSSLTAQPQVLDINGDDRQELVTLAEFGRLYAWELLTGERLYNIPTSGMKFPVIRDLNKDSQMELIAQTREGLRCWTINKAED